MLLVWILVLVVLDYVARGNLLMPYSNDSLVTDKSVQSYYEKSLFSIVHTSSKLTLDLLDVEEDGILRTCGFSRHLVS